MKKPGKARSQDAQPRRRTRSGCEGVSGFGVDKGRPCRPAPAPVRLSDGTYRVVLTDVSGTSWTTTALVHWPLPEPSRSTRRCRTGHDGEGA